MRAVVQRVLSASVDVDSQRVASIGPGLLVLVGLHEGDTDAEIDWLADKLPNLRIFEDAQGKMNLSVRDLTDPARGILLVPNFTIAGDATKGRRPSFDRAMRPERSEPMFARLTSIVRTNAAMAFHVEQGIFRASMRVSLVNDGPVTIIVEPPARAPAT